MLHYWLTAPEKYAGYHEDRDLLDRHPDVERVIDRTDLHTVLEVWFVDELFRTDDPALLEMHARAQPRAPEVPQPPGATPEEVRQGIIDRYLATPSLGRMSLARGFIEPLRRRMDYSGIARRALVVDRLPEGALPIYDRDPDVAGMSLPPPPPLSQPSDIPTLGLTTDGMFGTTFERLADLRDGALGEDLGFRPTGLGGPGVYQYGMPILSGNGAAIATIVAGRVEINGLNGVGPQQHVGHYLQIMGSSHPGNNGTFPIVEVNSSVSVWIVNPNATLDYFPALMWNVYAPVATLDGQALDVSFSWVPDPLDPKTVLKPSENPKDSAARGTGWGVVMRDDFLEND
jgi:hypothetical protein